MASFSLSEEALKLLMRIKCGQTIGSEDWDEIQNEEVRAYLRAECAIVDERYSEISDVLVRPCRPFVASVILAYRDLFLHPKSAVSRIQALLKDFPEDFEICWRARLEFWLADSLHLIGEIDIGQKALANALASLNDTGIFRSEALAVTALSEYIAGNNESAAKYHHLTRSELAKSPDLFLKIFNSSMALRVFLKACDPVGFELFSADLDQALLKKDDRRYLLRHTGYRAMLMTLVGDVEESARLWRQGDLLAKETRMRWERGQYGILRGLVAARSDGLSIAQSFFDQVEADLESVGFPGPYLAELNCARALAPAIAGGAVFGLRPLIAALEAARESLSSQAEVASSALDAYYRQAIGFLDNLIDGGAAESPPGPSLVVSIVSQLLSSRGMARDLSDFRVLPRFLNELKKTPGTKNDIALALQEAIRLPVRVSGLQLVISAPDRALETRPDLLMVIELGELLIRNHELISSGVRARVIAEISAQVAHDIRSPLGALKTARYLISPKQQEESDLIAMAVDRIQEIANDLIKVHREQSTPHFETVVRPWGVSEVLCDLLREKRLEYLGFGELVLQLNCDDEGDLLVMADPKHFRRAISNLLNNASEAMDYRGQVSCNVKVPRAGFIQVSILDCGPGFRSEQLSQDRDQSCNEVSSTKEGGLGLGLKHAREFAISAGGEFWMKNREDQIGAEVGVVLPAFHDNTVTTS